MERPGDAFLRAYPEFSPTKVVTGEPAELTEKQLKNAVHAEMFVPAGGAPGAIPDTIADTTDSEPFLVYAPRPGDDEGHVWHPDHQNSVMTVEEMPSGQARVNVQNLNRIPNKHRATYAPNVRETGKKPSRYDMVFRKRAKAVSPVQEAFLIPNDVATGRLEKEELAFGSTRFWKRVATRRSKWSHSQVSKLWKLHRRAALGHPFTPITKYLSSKFLPNILPIRLVFPEDVVIFNETVRREIIEMEFDPDRTKYIVTFAADPPLPQETREYYADKKFQIEHSVNTLSNEERLNRASLENRWAGGAWAGGRRRRTRVIPDG